MIAGVSRIVVPEYPCFSFYRSVCPGACLKIHFRQLYAPLRGILSPNSVSVAHYASFIGAQSPTKCDAHLTKSNFQTRSGALSAFP
ncbi:DUF6783 domain-containing protein [Hungatella hathewayi]|uniref:DUF6783 domain-containing protein n=1 Tax=Hungatella hathewayi TaxID=154046 RepID=UPI003569C0B4